MRDESTTPMQTCTKCGLLLPHDPEHFRNAGGGKLTVRCRSCLKEDERARRAARRDPEKVRREVECEALARDGLRRCTACGEIKPLAPGFFGARSTGRHGFRSQCNACRSEMTREWAKRNLDHVRAARAARYAASRAAAIAAARAYYYANREHCLARVKDYAKRNPSKVREYHRRGYERNRKVYLARARRWLAEHPERRRAYTRNRRARIKRLDGTHTGADVLAQYDRQRGRCYWCGKKVGAKYHADHVVPVSLGGSNGPENIVVACPACNVAKGAKHPMDWAGCLL